MKNYSVESITVGHNSAEVYIRLGDYVLIMPPVVMKKLQSELSGLHLTEKPVDTRKKARKPEPIAKQILKALFKGKQVTKSLIAINTKRKKKLPDQ